MVVLLAPAGDECALAADGFESVAAAESFIERLSNPPSRMMTLLVDVDAMVVLQTVLHAGRDSC